MRIVIMCCPGREAMVGRLRTQLVGATVIEVWDAQREGSLPCALRAFEMGLDVFKGGPFTVLQDDAEVCAGFVEYAETFMADVAAHDLVIQWYAHGWVAGALSKNTDPKFEEFGGHDYVCSLATTYSPRWAEKIRAHLRDMVDHDGHRDDHGRMYGDDAAISDVLAWERKEFYVHVPSLVQHIGRESMIAGREVNLSSHDARTSRCYVGADFDARTLIGEVEIPWANKKETAMDDGKKIGDMTLKELSDALGLGVKIPAPAIHAFGEMPYVPPKTPVPTEERIPTVKFAPNCNQCGALEGKCNHPRTVVVRRGQPDIENV